MFVEKYTWTNEGLEKERIIFDDIRIWYDEDRSAYIVLSRNDETLAMIELEEECHYQFSDGYALRISPKLPSSGWTFDPESAREIESDLLTALNRELFRNSWEFMAI